MTKKTATLYRMNHVGHVCPFGLKAKDLLQREGFSVVDNTLDTREETDAFKQKHNVKTTPLIWINEERIGGFSDLEAYFGKKNSSESQVTYKPVIMIFIMAALMAVAVSYVIGQNPFTVQVLERFVAIAICLLAVQKLQDVERFSTMFLNYDLLAQRWVPYGKVYPYAEALSGVLMLSGGFVWLSAPIMLFIGGIGAISVFKAVYIEKRELKCACVGGESKVPLGFVSLLENVIMVSMAIWMIAKLTIAP